MGVLAVAYSIYGKKNLSFGRSIDLGIPRIGKDSYSWSERAPKRDQCRKITTKYQHSVAAQIPETSTKTIKLLSMSVSNHKSPNDTPLKRKIHQMCITYDVSESQMTDL